jgi:DNA-binding response OmpR family regulator
MGNPLALVIEDSSDVAAVVARALEMLNFETEVIYSGDLALKRLAATKPALVILDLNLPRVSGAEILRCIRADERLAKTCVIVTSAHPEIVEDISHTADLVLLKPIDIRQLCSLVEQLNPLWAS